MLKRLAAICGMLFLCVLLLFFLMEHEVKRGRSEYTKRNPIQETALYKGDFQLYTSGSHLYRALFQDIQNAKSHIYIHFFIIRNDSISKKFLTLLASKAAEGVEVKLSADLLGGHDLTDEAVAQLRKHGGTFMYSRTLQTGPLFYNLHHRNHRRMAIIDGNISYIGGFNMGDEYLGKNKLLGHWRDYHVRIVGNGAAAVEAQFVRDWGGRGALRRETMQPAGEVLHQYVFSSGSGLEEKTIQWIDAAKQSIWIANPYFVPSQSIIKALERAMQRGVTLHILVTRVTDAWFIQPAAYSYLNRLLRKGAAVHEYTNGFFHGKVFVVDDRMASIGTANFDQRSFFLNDESNCLIYDKAMVQKLTNELQHDRKHTERLQLSNLEQLPIWNKLMQQTPLRIQYYF